MKLRIIATFLILVPGLISAQQLNQVTITGKLSETGNYKIIYLDSLDLKSGYPVSSDSLRKDGSFLIKANIPTTNLFRLRLDDKNFLTLILSPGEKVIFTSKGPKLGVDALVKGSKHSEILYNTIGSLRKLDQARDSLNKAYNEVQTSPDRETLSAAIIKEFNKADSLQKVILTNAINQDPASLAWLFFQDRIDIAKDFPLVDKFDSQLIKNYPDNPFVKAYHQQVESERKTAIGSPAPDIALPDKDGVTRKLSSLKGKVVLLDFWASWCGPCRRENPNVVRIYNEYHGKGFEIFSVSLDKDREAWLRGIETDKLIWPDHVSDLKYWKSEGAAIYGVTAIPYTVLIDRSGKIAAKKLRGEDLEAKIKELLQ